MRKCKHKAETCVSKIHHKACLAVAYYRLLELKHHCDILLKCRKKNIPKHHWGVVFGKKEAKAMLAILKIIDAK